MSGRGACQQTAATSLRCAAYWCWLRADHMLTVAASPLLSLSLPASQPLAPRSLNCSQSPPSLSPTFSVCPSCPGCLPLSAHTLSFVSHSAHNLSAVEKDTINTSALSTRIQFVPTIKSICFLDLSCLYTIVTTHAEQTCPNRRRLPKGGTNRRPLIFGIWAIYFDIVNMIISTSIYSESPQ